MTKAYLFDLDGTLADCSHRIHLIQQQPKLWDEFFSKCEDDSPIEHMCDLARLLNCGETTVVYVSGRSDQCREQTEDWLFKNGLWTGHLYMRREGDHRDDDIIKLELLEQLRADGLEPICAFDDRNRVVRAWRSAGIPCLQVADGDF